MCENMMDKKILIVDDIDAVNVGVKGVLEDLGLKEITYCTYCDDAYLKIKKASLDSDPYDAIICDLSFVEDHRERELTSGQELMQRLKQEYPALKTIAFSVEDHPHTIKILWEDIGVDAYVCKNREGVRELAKAIKSVVGNGERYLPQQVEMQLKQDNTILLSSYDEQLLQLLALGNNQYEIESIFKKDRIKPASRSSIEKRLKDLREDFGASTNVHLISILKDFRLI